MISESTRFYRETLPAQWNQSLEEQIDRSRSGDEQSRILEDMRRVDASIQVVVDGAGGGRHALNVSAGRMEAADAPAHPPFLTIRHEAGDLEALRREAGDSTLAFLGGLAGLAGEMRLTTSRIENLADLAGSIAIEIEGDPGFRVWLHFGKEMLPDAPACTIRVDSDTYRELRRGELPPHQAFLSGRVRVEGDLDLGIQLALAALAPD